MTVPPTGAAYHFPLSPQQHRLWLREQVDPDNPAYLIPLALRIRGPVDHPALRAAVQAVTNRHEVLRTRFPRTEPVAVVPDTDTVAWSVIDLSGLAAGDRALDAVAVAVAGRPIPLWSGPPLRCTAIRVAADDHLLLITVHHIAFDGWSTGILAAELLAGYRARTTGTGPHPTPLVIQYGDYAEWQRDRLTPARAAAELDYWTTALGSTPTVLDLPTDHPRPARPGHRGARTGRTLDATATTGLERWAARHGATLFMALACGYALVLGRLAGQDSIVLGTPTAGRDRPETHPLIGCFINVLPVPIDLSGEPTGGALLARVRDACLAAFAHQDLPFDQLVEHLRIARDPSRTPVFQAAIMLQDGAPDVFELPGLELSMPVLDPGVAKYDLSLDIARRTDGGLALALEYRSDIYAATTADLVLAHLLAALTGLTGADAADPVPRLGFGTPARADGVTRPVPPGSVLDAVEATIRGRRTCLIDGATGHAYTGDAVLARATAVAAALTRAGVRHGDLVGVHLDRGADTVAVLLGVWRSGAAYLPLDPRYPASRLAFIVGDAGIRTVISSVTDPPPFTSVDVVFIDELDAADTADIAAHRPAAADIAYVLYTSGSTGRPKGVPITHAAVRNLLDSMARDVGLGPGDVLVAVTTLSFDISVLELFGPLAYGAVLVVAAGTQSADPAELGPLLRRHHATVLQATPVTWRMLLDDGWRPEPGLRGWCGGEALPPDLARRLVTAGVRLTNVYGPTETTIWSTATSVDPDDITLGRPLANTDAHILDRRMRPVPVGAPGELWLGGAGMAIGYLGRAGLTADRFRPHPARRGARLYRTGDLARLRADGQLIFAGRTDHQVKLRGFRIELGEVEAALAALPGVRAAAATVQADQLIGYLVPVDGHLLDLVAARRTLRDHLPDHLVPARLGELTGLPVTPNGKTDRAALPILDTADPGPGPAADPTDGWTAAILDCFRTVLDQPDYPVTEDFFAAGGSSIAAVRLVRDVERISGVRLTVAEFFQASTPAGVAALIRGLPAPDHPAADHPSGADLPFDPVAGPTHPLAWAPGRVAVTGDDGPLRCTIAAALHATGIALAPLPDADAVIHLLPAAPAQTVDVLRAAAGDPHRAVHFVCAGTDPAGEDLARAAAWRGVPVTVIRGVDAGTAHLLVPILGDSTNDGRTFTL